MPEFLIDGILKPSVQFFELMGRAPTRPIPPGAGGDQQQDEESLHHEELQQWDVTLLTAEQLAVRNPFSSTCREPLRFPERALMLRPSPALYLYPSLCLCPCLFCPRISWKAVWRKPLRLAAEAW